MSNAPQSDFESRHAASSQSDPRGHLIDGLRRQLGRREAATTADESAVFSCGAVAIDRLLPGGGLRYGMLIEWLAGHVAAGGSPARRAAGATKITRTTGGPPVATCGAATLGLLSAREACREGGVLVVIDRRQTFYPPAAAAWGIDLDRLIVVRPQSARDELWAAVQALRSPVVAALWAAIDRLESRAFRRLQLAAQAGRTLGVLMRPTNVRGQPSWADVTLEAGPLSVVRSPLHSNHGQRTTDNGRYIQVHIMRCHSGRAGGSTTLEIDDAAHTVQEMNPNHDAHPLPVVTELADPAGHSLSARA